MSPASLPWRAQNVGGNGAAHDPLSNRLDRLEQCLEAIQKQLDVQFQRIADMQVQLDRLSRP
jgi:hypothetical protein